MAFCKTFHEILQILIIFLITLDSIQTISFQANETKLHKLTNKPKVPKVRVASCALPENTTDFGKLIGNPFTYSVRKVRLILYKYLMLLSQVN